MSLGIGAWKSESTHAEISEPDGYLNQSASTSAVVLESVAATQLCNLPYTDNIPPHMVGVLLVTNAAAVQLTLVPPAGPGA
jgi:hypothetical protein